MKIYYANMNVLLHLCGVLYGELNTTYKVSFGGEKIVDIDGYNGIMIHYRTRESASSRT